MSKLRHSPPKLLLVVADTSSQGNHRNDLDMLEVGNGNMNYDEYKTHFSMWAAIKSPLIMGNNLNTISAENFAILLNPAVLAISQDPAGSAIGRVYREQLSEKDRYGYGEYQVWQGSLDNGDYVVAMINAGNTSRTVSSSLVEIFGGLSTNQEAQKTWNLFDVWGNETVMPTSVAAQVLNGSLSISNATGYYNASQTSFAEGLAQNTSLLFGTPAGHVAAGGTLSAEIPRHGIAMYRLRNAGVTTRKRDEL
jgi:alpha-galactosidase